MVTSDELLNKINETCEALQAAQRTVVQGAEQLGNAVHLTGEETVSGKKTFTTSPEVPDVADGDNSGKAINARFVGKAIGNESKNTVHTTGNESLSGIKTFTTPPVFPTPTNIEKTSMQGAPVSWVRDMLRAEVEAMSSGRNTVIRDNKDNPHIMVVVPRFNLQDIDASLGTGPHPAFIINGVVKSELLIGKYVASKGADNRAHTLPGKFPWVNINFDNAIAAARALGAGFGLCTNAIYAARALWMMKQLGEHEYLGNTNWGRHHTKTWQTGVMQTNAFNPGDTGNNVTAATLTGSGPVDWNDDGTPWGISDLVGNVWEWNSGMRLNEGEIQIIPDNDAMLASVSMAANSASWKAIAANGALVAPGTANTLKYDAPAVGDGSNTNVGAPLLSTSIANQLTGSNNCFAQFNALQPASGLTPPAIVKSLGLYPFARDASVQGHFWMRNHDERVGLRGGGWNYGADCGPFYLNLSGARALSSWNVGFRVAFLA